MYTYIYICVRLCKQRTMTEKQLTNMFEGFNTMFGCSSSALVSEVACCGNQSTLTADTLTSSPIHRSPPSKASLAIGEPSTVQPGGQRLSVKSINSVDSLMRTSSRGNSLQGGSRATPKVYLAYPRLVMISIANLSQE